MDKISNIQSKIFFECKNILTTISKIETKEELVSKQDLFYEITERISFLKILEKNDGDFTSHQVSIQNEEIEMTTDEFNTITEPQEEVSENQGETEEQIIETSVEITEKIVSEQEKEANENRDEIKDGDSTEKKIKLSNIKKIQPQNLFSEGILHQNNNDSIEQPKKEREFKLDLNDRIAFTKILFNGSQLELKETINTLNTFTSLDEAKEYLSDMYYEKNWDKVDEYAQRLWILVESKFI